MIPTWQILSLIPCLLLCGAGCAGPRVVDPGPCPTEIIVQEKLIELPADLLLPQPCPTVPDHGDVAHLLDWSENCAISARLANEQLDAIRALQE